MIFDSQLLFSDAQSLVTSTTVVSTNAINLSNSRDMGLGDGIQPKVVGFIGTALTAACATATMTVKFMGSTDSSAWTEYLRTPALTTASYGASTKAFQFDLPPRPPGVAMPKYYRLDYVFDLLLATTISTGTITSGIILEVAESQGTLGQYASGFSVA